MSKTSYIVRLWLSVNHNRSLFLMLACLVLVVPTTGPDCRRTSETNCSDGEDNDCDGAIDCADYDCCSREDCPACTEICDNSVDDDSDGLIDCEDPDCSTDANCSERFNCGDGVDNDLDGDMDCDDVGCFDHPLCAGRSTMTESLDPQTTSATSNIKDRPESDDVVADMFGCVTTPCGTICGLDPLAQYTVSCGMNAVVQYPEEMDPASGSCQNTDGDFVGVFAQEPDNFLFSDGVVNPVLQNQTLRVERDYEAAVFDSTTANEILSTWTCQMLFFHDAIDFIGRELKIWPVVQIAAPNGDRIIVPYLADRIDFASAPDGLIHTIVTPTQPGDVAISAKGRPTPAGINSDLTIQLTAMNRSPMPVNDTMITGSLSNNFVFDPVQSDDDVVHDGSATGGTFTISAGTMESTEAQRFRIVGQSQSAGIVNVTANISATEVDPDLSNNSVSLDTDVGDFADLTITASSNQSPLITNADATVTIRMENTGPLDATGATYDVTIPSDAQFISSTAGTHDGSPTGGIVTGSTDLNVFETQSLDIVLRPVSAGNDIVSVSGMISLPGGMTDPNPSDNTVTIDLPQVDDTSGTPYPLLTTQQMDQHVGLSLSTSVPTGLQNDVINSINKPHVASDNQTFAIHISLGSGDDTIIIGTTDDLRAVVRESVSLTTDTGQTIGAIDDKIGINASGDFSFAGRIIETNVKAAFKANGNNLPGGGGTLTVIAAQNDVLPSPINTLSATIHQVLIDDLGKIYFGADTSGPTQQDFFVLSTEDDGQSFSIVLQEGVTVPANQAGGGTSAWDNVDNEISLNRNGITISGDGQRIGVRGDLEGSALTDDILAVNNTIVFQEGEDFGGTLNPSDGGFAGHVDSRSGAEYVRGTAQGGTSFVARNGQLAGVEGTEIFPGAAETWENSFLFITDDGADGFVIGGRTDQSPNGVIVHFPGGDTPRVIVRAGEPIDMDRNGLFDDDTILSFPTSDSAVLSQNSRLVFKASISDRDGNFAGTVLLCKDVQPPSVVGIATVNDVEVERVNWNNHASTLAEINVDVTLTNNAPQIVYMNVLADLDDDGQFADYAVNNDTQAEWIVRNFPIFGNAGDDVLQSAAFSLIDDRLRTDNDPLNLVPPRQVDAFVTIATAPTNDPQAADPNDVRWNQPATISMPFGKVPTGGARGTPIPVGSMPDANNGIFAQGKGLEDISQFAGNFGMPDNAQDLNDGLNDPNNPMPGMAWVRRGHNECGPTAVANSFRWLARRNGFNNLLPTEPVTGSDDALINELTQTMDTNGVRTGRGAGTPGTAGAGTLDPDVVLGKGALIDNRGLPLSVQFRDGDTEILGVPANAPTADYIFNLLDDPQGKDIEIGFTFDGGGGHWVTLVGMTTFTNGSRYVAIHDPGDQAKTKPKTDVYPIGTRDVGGVTYVEIQGYGKRNFVDIVVAECPQPTPEIQQTHSLSPGQAVNIPGIDTTGFDGDGPYTFQVAPSDLIDVGGGNLNSAPPDGLSIDPATGAITGTAPASAPQSEVAVWVFETDTGKRVATVRMAFDEIGCQDVCADANCDGVVDSADTAFFAVALLHGETGWAALFGGMPPCDFCVNDTNGDGQVNGADVQKFTGAVLNGSCP